MAYLCVIALVVVQGFSIPELIGQIMFFHPQIYFQFIDES
jgi:hypothetical protein